MYEYTDKVIRYMRKKFIRLFNQFNGLTSFDELNVIQSSKSLYEELEKITEEGLLLIAKRAYKDQSGKFANAISVAWLLGWLNDYNPVTKYVYMHEIERKCARFAESILASDNRAKEIETALRYWSNMVTQYATRIHSTRSRITHESARRVSNYQIPPLNIMSFSVFGFENQISSE